MFQDCPPPEREICWWYEYAREGCRGAPVQLALFPDLQDNNLFPEWPREPYLTIPAIEREQRLIQLQRGTLSHLRCLNLMPAFSVPISPDVAKRYLDGFRVFEFSEDGSELRQRHLWPIREINDACWIVLFRIDWRRSDSEILTDFAAWLKEYRPKAFPSKVGSKTAAGSYPRELQADLKALGALRLLRFYKHWQHIPTEAEIYESQAGWMTAQQKAEKHLNFFRL